MFQFEHLQSHKAPMSPAAPSERKQDQERSKTENRSAFAQAMKRRNGAVRGMLGMGSEPDNDPEVDEQAASDRFHGESPPIRASRSAR
jgi:hypothetical protein